MSTPTPAPQSDTAALIAAIERLSKGELIAIANEGSKNPIRVLATAHGLVSIKSQIDEYRQAPERRAGTARLQDLDSLILHVNRHKDTDSVLFANRSAEAPNITAVLDYNKAGPDIEAARFGRHRAVYAFPLSEEWQAWHAQDGKQMAQRDFAAFLEDRIVDVIAPPDFEHAVFDYSGDDEAKRRAAKPDIALKEMAELIGGNFAGPARMMEMAKGLSLSADINVKGAQNLSTGETSIVYTEEHRDAGGAPLKVPNLFLIAIPVFDAGPLYRLAVRLRYRLAQGRITWWFDIHRADRVFDHAFTEACIRARDECALPLFYGVPEA